MTVFRTELISHLRSTAPPWVAVTAAPGHVPVPRLASSLPGFRIFLIDGRSCRTRRGLFTEFAARLAFPSYFGENWDALEECLGDLEWAPAPGYVILVDHGEDVLAETPDDYATLVEILRAAGAAWASRGPDGGAPAGVPFHTLLATTTAALETHDWRMPRIVPAPSP